MPRTHGIPQGSADPCVFTRQRKIAISSRRLDTALLCAAKKRGVEKNQLAGLCQNLPWTTGPVKKPLAAAGSKKRHPLSWMPSLFEVKKLSLRELRRAASCLQAVLREFLSCFPLILRAFPAFCLSVIRCADHKKRPFSFSNSLMKRTIYYPK